MNPDPLYLTLGIPLCLVMCEVSFRIFQKSKKAFADVL